MCGACGTVSENGSDVPEPGAIARSQSVFLAWARTFARKIPWLFAPMYATVRQLPLLPCRSWTVTRALLLVASRPQMLTVDPPRYATNGNRKAVRSGFGRAFSSDEEWKWRPLWYGLGLRRSCRSNQGARDTPEIHIWCKDSAVQREARPIGAPWGRGGLLSQPNSVTQNLTGCAETTWWSRTPALSTARIRGRSPSSTSSGWMACPNGPPNVYGWCDHASKWTAL